MGFPSSKDVVFKHFPHSLTAMRIEKFNPQRIIYSRKCYHSVQAVGSAPMQAITQFLVKNRSILTSLVPAPAPAIRFTFFLSLVGPLFASWFVAFLLRFSNLGLPQGRKKRFLQINRNTAAKKFLENIKNEERFYFVYGGHATGKTTLIRAALAQRRVGSVYVLMEEGLDVSLEKLAMKIYMATSCLLLVSFNLQAWIAKAAGFGSRPGFDELFKVDGFLHAIANNYRRMWHKNLILVLDGVNILPKDVLKDLVGVAKNLADASPLNIILVGTGGQLPFVCSETSSLMRGSFLMAPQISNKALRKYIRLLHKNITEEALELLLNLVGGKITNIRWCISHLKNGVTLEQLSCLYENTFTYNSFALAGLLDLENKAWVQVLFKKMKSRGGAVHVSEFQDIVPRVEIWRLNAGSVFTIDEEKMISFECRANEEYAWRWLSRFEAQQSSSEQGTGQGDVRSRRTKKTKARKAEPLPPRLVPEIV